jgi:hypothetical protein
MTIKGTNSGKRIGRKGKSIAPSTRNIAKPYDPSVRLYLDAALADNTRRGNRAT